MRVSKKALGFFILLVVVGILQFALARRHSLWADEFFSLAMATGHSLEHRAADAQPQLGDFVEPQGPVPAVEFRRYLQHESPPASPARVIRAVLLSDTSPPLYYLLLQAWTLISGTSDLALRLFSVTFSIASLPLVAALAYRIADRRAAIASSVLFAFSPLVVYYSTEGRIILPPHFSDPCDGICIAPLARTRIARRLLFTVGRALRRRFPHALFLRLSLASQCRLPFSSTRQVSASMVVPMHLGDRLDHLSMGMDGGWSIQ